MNETLMVGYLQSWVPSDLTFTQAAEQGYNAIVMAFGEIKGSNVGIVDDAFNPSPTYEEFKNDILNAKEKGAKHILFSVGGESGRNTYFPNGVAVKEVASSLVEFLEEYGFTGVDFDLEIDEDGDYLDSLCQEIKKLNPSLIITAAPQLNQADHNTNLFLVSTGNAQVYNKAVVNKRFDYLFIQAYNNQWPVVNGFNETQVGFISEGFKNLKNTVPTETKIVIGEPANKNAAGTSIFTVSDVPNNVYQLIRDQFEIISSDEQFGGAMVWNINFDRDNDYQFIKSVKEVVIDKVTLF